MQHEIVDDHDLRAGELNGFVQALCEAFVVSNRNLVAVKQAVDLRVGQRIRNRAQIRKERLRVLGLDAEVSNYAQWERVQEELDFAKGIMRRTGCRTFDVTNRAIEETAQEILDCLRR